MLLSGDIVSKRGEIEPQITPPPVEITIGVAVPLVEVSTSSEISYDTIKNAVLKFGLPYEVYEEAGEEKWFVYYLVSSELNIDEDSLDQILPGKVGSVKTIARQVYDYLASMGVDFVLAVCLYKTSSWSVENVYTILQVPFKIDNDDPDKKEFLKRDIDFVFVVYPVSSSGDDDITNFSSMIDTVASHIDICSKKEIQSLDEKSTLPKIGQLERFFVLGLPPRESLISSVYNKVSKKDGAVRRTVLLTSNFTEAYLPTIFGGEAEESLPGPGDTQTFPGSGGTELPYTSVAGQSLSTSTGMQSLSDSTGTQTSYGLLESSSGKSIVYDFTWSLIGLPFVMAYINGNLARPLTGKPIGEITFGGTKVGMLVLSKLYTLYGACLLLADNPNEAPTCYRSNTMAYGVEDYGNSREYGIEDTEFSLMFVEDTMDKINRAFLRAFRGNILNKTMVKVIEERFKRFVLDDYLSKGWILAYRNVKFKQDESDPTKVVGSYAYMPAYPINKIWVEHFFIL
jgi:hypothetical protein